MQSNAETCCANFVCGDADAGGELDDVDGPSFRLDDTHEKQQLRTMGFCPHNVPSRGTRGHSVRLGGATGVCGGGTCICGKMLAGVGRVDS